MLSITFILVTTFIVAHTQDLTCESSKWTKFQGNCYRKLYTRKIYDECVKDCMEENATLVSIKDKDEHDFLVDNNFTDGEPYTGLTLDKQVQNENKCGSGSTNSEHYSYSDPRVLPRCKEGDGSRYATESSEECDGEVKNISVL